MKWKTCLTEKIISVRNCVRVQFYFTGNFKAPSRYCPCNNSTV